MCAVSSLYCGNPGACLSSSGNHLVDHQMKVILNNFPYHTVTCENRTFFPSLQQVTRNLKHDLKLEKKDR
ncbi:hypothetical protein DUNSADRAFT_11811 [Dunaliella salina]|uniref:Encoded protein n=1 Tax=Dunaliella salina TaxID=3046 RepID=A0ABQ7GCJ5_DUNSA|nr:hypothetical protein DUNSADRAFT_11811 [Dunaliella salina]|eukprot:KAF5832335.1 hypothetical protein DUNSADRAFT_11811 [Dunaliella salina]